MNSKERSRSENYNLTQIKMPTLSLKLAFAERKGLLVPSGHAAPPLVNLPLVDFEPNGLIEGSHPFLTGSFDVNKNANPIAKVGICREEGITRTLRARRTASRESPFGRFRTQWLNRGFSSLPYWVF
jgi:hypothetical protein